MDLKDLRESWQSCDPCNGRSDADWERMTTRVAAGKMQSAQQRLLRRWNIFGIVAALLPLQILPLFRDGDATTRLAAWIFLALFVGAVLWRIFRLRDLLREIDPATRSLRETCTAAVRLRRSFLHGVVLNVTLAVLLFGTLCLHRWTLNQPEWFYGFGAGLLIGIPIGFHVFRRTLRDIDDLSTALRNVDEA